MSFVFQLVFHLSLTVVLLHAKGPTSAVKDECAKEMSDHVVNSKWNKCCADFMGCTCIKALCKTKDFRLEKDCLADSLYKSCNDEYQKSCSSVSEANFAEKCKGMDKDHWGRKEKSGKTSLLIPFIIAAVLVLLLGIAASWLIVHWYLPESKSKKSNEIGTIQSKRKSRSEGSKRKSNSSKRKSVVAQDKSKSKSKSTKPKGKLTKTKDKNVIKSVFHAKSTKSRPNQSQTGSFDSRAFTPRKVKGKVPKGKVTKLTYAKLKKALM